MKPQAAISGQIYCALRDACFRTIARMLVVSYLLFSIRPAMPVILDNLAHRYQPEQHFRLVHAHGGSEHVHLEMQKTLKEDAQEGKDHRVKIVFDDLVCLNEHCVVPQESTAVAVLNYHTPVRWFFPIADREPDFPPPRA